MEIAGELRVNPGTLQADGEDLEIIVPYTEWSLAAAVLERAVALTAGLNAKVMLVAVHTVPYPAQFECQAAVHAHLVEQLVDLASRCPLAVQPQVVLARSREEGFRYVINARSTVLIGSRKHWWRTAEAALARDLARDGHRVALLHVC